MTPTDLEENVENIHFSVDENAVELSDEDIDYLIKNLKEAIQEVLKNTEKTQDY